LGLRGFGEKTVERGHPSSKEEMERTPSLGAKKQPRPSEKIAISYGTRGREDREKKDSITAF